MEGQDHRQVQVEGHLHEGDGAEIGVVKVDQVHFVPPEQIPEGRLKTGVPGQGAQIQILPGELKEGPVEEPGFLPGYGLLGTLGGRSPRRQEAHIHAQAAQGLPQVGHVGFGAGPGLLHQAVGHQEDPERSGARDRGGGRQGGAHFTGLGEFTGRQHVAPQAGPG